MWFVIILVALMIPTIGILVDSPIGRALARRVGGEEHSPPDLIALARKVDALEAQVDDLGSTVEQLREENQFLQRLLEAQPGQRSTLPPARNP